MEFCYLRAGRGKPSSATDAAGLDTQWTAYARDAVAAGLQVGGYWRFFPSVDLDRQIDAFTRRVNFLPSGSLPPLVDVEDTDGLLRAALTDWTTRALIGTSLKTGRVPVLYTYASFLAEQLDADRLLPRWPLSLARWTTSEAWPDQRAEFWQYAGNVTVPWAAGRVDLQRRRT